MKPFPLVLALSLLLTLSPVAAEETDPPEFVEVPPPPPVNIDPQAGVEEPDDLEPEVTIIDRKDASYEEYRLNGRLYMIKVVPVVGPPYFYIDRDGDGLLETRRTHRTAQPEVPQWVIFSW